MRHIWFNPQFINVNAKISLMLNTSLQTADWEKGLSVKANVKLNCGLGKNAHNRAIDTAKVPSRQPSMGGTACWKPRGISIADGVLETHIYRVLFFCCLCYLASHSKTNRFPLTALLFFTKWNTLNISISVWIPLVILSKHRGERPLKRQSYCCWLGGVMLLWEDLSRCQQNGQPLLLWSFVVWSIRQCRAEISFFNWVGVGRVVWFCQKP